MSNIADVWAQVVRKHGQKHCLLYVEDERASSTTAPRRKRQPLDRRPKWDKGTRAKIGNSSRFAVTGGSNYFSEQHAPGRAESLLPEPKANISFHELDQRANRFAQWGLQQRLTSEMSVGMVVGNRIEFFEAWLGFIKIGVRVDLYKPNLDPLVLLHCIMTSKPRFVIFEYAPEVEQVCAKLRAMDDERLSKGQTTSGDGRDGMSWWTWHNSHDWAQCLNGREGPYTCPSSAPDRGVRAGVGASSPCTVTYGGAYIMGSQPPCKGEATTHAQFVQYGQIVVRHAGIGRRDVIHGGGLALYHMLAGLGMFSVVMASGATYLIKRRFNTFNYFPECRQHKCTVIHYHKELLERLFAVPWDNINFSGEPKHERAHIIRVALGRGVEATEWETIQQRFGFPDLLELSVGTVDGDGDHATYYEPRSLGVKRVTLDRNGELGQQVEWAPPKTHTSC